MATPQQMNNPMMSMFGNQPTMYPAMMANMGQQRPVGNPSQRNMNNNDYGLPPLGDDVFIHPLQNIGNNIDDYIGEKPYGIPSGFLADRFSNIGVDVDDYINPNPAHDMFFGPGGVSNRPNQNRKEDQIPGMPVPGLMKPQENPHWSLPHPYQYSPNPLDKYNKPFFNMPIQFNNPYGPIDPV